MLSVVRQGPMPGEAGAAIQLGECTKHIESLVLIPENLCNGQPLAIPEVEFASVCAIALAPGSARSDANLQTNRSQTGSEQSNCSNKQEGARLRCHFVDVSCLQTRSYLS